MRRVHGEATECVVFIGRQRNAWEPTGWVGTECVVVFIGRAWTEQAMETRPGVPQNGTPRDTVHLHRRPPPASTGYRRPPPASTGSCSSSLHRALLHRLLFNHPPPSTVHPALHTTGSCSTIPPRPPLHRLLFIHPSTPWVPVHPEATPPLTVHPNPPATLTIHPRGSIDRLQLAAVAKESLDRVQLTAIDRSLGFSNA